MPVMLKQWDVAPLIPSDVDNELHLYPAIIRQLLFNRGITSDEQARQFLDAKLPISIDTKKIRNISKAVNRIRKAINLREKIIVYGDYDADGVTATALLVLVLKTLNADVKEHIPNRLDEGYGLNLEALSTMHDDGVSLIITVDCGIRSFIEADYALREGMDLIITDHHYPLEALPAAFAVINPKQLKDNYPEKELAGVGLAYKLAVALANSYRREPFDPNAFLDLVAIGTIADMVPLTGENRSLVRSGMEWIRKKQNQGLFSLINGSGLNPDRISATDIGYMVAPRLNAAGRLETALTAFNLLTTRDIYQAGRLAQELEVQNNKRQKIMQDIQEKAENLVFINNKDPLLLYAGDPGFNIGVVGLAASRLTEKYYRPSIIASIGESMTRASCRSIPEFHITQALDQCKDLLEHHGGHAAAAGFTVRNELLPALLEKMNEIAKEQLMDIDLQPKIRVEAEIPLSDLKPGLLKYLEQLQPTGMGNPAPIFMSRGLKVTRQKAIGTDGSHLKFSVTDGKITYDAIAFRQGHWIAHLPPEIDLVYTFELNQFNGQVNLQLNVKDIRPST